MRIRRGRLLVLAGVVAAALYTGVTIQRSGAAALFRENRRCCQLSFLRNLLVTLDEIRGLTEYSSEIGQDKWVLEKVFPGVSDGYFVDIGSGHGTIGSNSRTLETRGWTGVCIDPFPVHMEGRTCRVFEEVVFSRPGLVMAFHTAGGLGGVADTLGKWNETAARAPTLNVTTVTLDDVLARATPRSSFISCPWTSRGLNWKHCGHSPSIDIAWVPGPSSTIARSRSEARSWRCSHNTGTAV